MISVSAMVSLSVSVLLACLEANSSDAMPGEVESTNEASLETSKVEVESDEVLDGKWLNSFEDARKLAIEKNIPVVLHFEAVWCGACRQMDSAVLNQPTVLEHLGTTVIGVRVDADRDPDLIAKHGISSLPTEVVIGPDGKEIGRYAGNATLDEYMSRLNKSGATNAAEQSTAKPEDDENLRRCLLVMRDGKVVGLGGFCPVAMIRDKKWLKGSEEFVGTYDGVDYFFMSAEEREDRKSVV